MIPDLGIVRLCGEIFLRKSLYTLSASYIH